MAEHHSDHARDADEEADSPVFQVLDEETIRAMRAGMLEKARSQAAVFPDLLARLRSLLQTVYPPHLIAVMAGWGLRTATGPEGVSGMSMIQGVQQHHVELLQAVALTLPDTAWGDVPAEPPQMQQAIDLTLELTESFAGRRLLAAEDLTNVQARTVLGLQERLRTHTQMVRNWGRYSEMLRILRGLYAPLDEPFCQHHGFGALEFIAVAEQTVTAIEAQVNGRFRLLKDIFRASAVTELVRSFFARFPGVAGDPEELLGVLNPEDDLESVRRRLLVHADRWLVMNSVAPVTAIASAVGAPEAHVRAILDRLSLTPGALTDENPEHLFLANPVWLKPGLKTGDEYFFAFPQTAVSFLQPILRALCEESGLKTALEDRRAAYLEFEMVRILTAALPEAQIAPGAEWTWNGQNFETDVLVRLDRTVLIAEGKSATLTAQGLRGAPARVARHVGELIVDPSIQSARLEQVIKAGRSGDGAANAVARGLGLEPSEVDTVIRISVTLDDLSVLSSAERELQAAGWTPPDLQLATTLNLADLACVADILPRPCQFLHYFSERSRLQKQVDVFGFELDFLGLYLQTGFNMAGAEEYGRLVITDMSRPIDHYYQNLEIGVSGPMPTPRLDPMFAAILDGLEVRRPHGWTTMAMDLLRAGNADEQRACAEMVEAVRQQVLLKHRDPEHRNAVVLIPLTPRDAAVVIHIFPRTLRTERNDVIRRLVGQALEESGLPRCVFVSRMIEAWDGPYDAVGLAVAR